MDSSIIFIIISLFLGIVIGILYSTKNGITKKRKITIEGLVKVVVFWYGLVLIVTGSLNVLERIIPDYRYRPMNDDVLQMFTAFGTVFLGAMAVILSGRQHKERQKQEILDEIISPLYFEIQHIRDNLLLDTSQTIYSSNIKLEQWEKISGTYNEIRAKRIDANILLFYDMINDFTTTLSNIKFQLDSIMNEYFNEFVLGPIGYLINTDRTPHFWLSYSTKLETKHIFLAKMVIFGDYSMTFDEWDPLFEEENCFFTYTPIKGPTDGYGDIIPFEVRYTDAKEAFQEMLLVLEANLSKENYIQVIRKKRLELIDMAADILINLESYIES